MDDDATCWALRRPGQPPRYLTCGAIGFCACRRPVPAQHQLPVYPPGELVRVLRPYGQAADGHEGNYTVTAYVGGAYHLAWGEHLPDEARDLEAAGEWELALDRLRVVAGWAPAPPPGYGSASGGTLEVAAERFSCCDGHWRCTCGDPENER